MGLRRAGVVEEGGVSRVEGRAGRGGTGRVGGGVSREDAVSGRGGVWSEEGGVRRKEAASGDGWTEAGGVSTVGGKATTASLAGRLKLEVSTYFPEEEEGSGRPRIRF